VEVNDSTLENRPYIIAGRILRVTRSKTIQVKSSLDLPEAVPYTKIPLWPKAASHNFTLSAADLVASAQKIPADVCFHA
jgi:hypothetical protein